MSEKFDNLGRREFIKRGLIGSTLLAGELTNGFGLVRGFLEDLFADEAKENWDHKFEIPENHIKEVRDFFTFLDQPISNLDIKKATELLNKFRTDWDVSISNPLGPKDSNKDLILLSGPEEGWNLATGKKLTDRERKFFLKKENPLLQRFCTGSVVVFPAPFGPRNPKNSPSGMTSERSSTAVKLPNFFVTCRSSIIVWIA